MVASASAAAEGVPRDASQLCYEGDRTTTDCSTMTSSFPFLLVLTHPTVSCNSPCFISPYGRRAAPPSIRPRSHQPTLRSVAIGQHPRIIPASSVRRAAPEIFLACQLFEERMPLIARTYRATGETVGCIVVEDLTTSLGIDFEWFSMVL